MKLKKLLCSFILSIFSLGSIITPSVALASETDVMLISTVVTIDIPGGKDGGEIVYVDKERPDDKPSIEIVDKDGNKLEEGKLLEDAKITSPDGVKAEIDKDGSLIITNNTGKDIDKIFVQYLDNDGDEIYDEVVISVKYADGTTDGNIPQMGDSNAAILASIVAGGSALIILGVLFAKRNKKENNS